MIRISHVNLGGQIVYCLTKGLGVKECSIVRGKMGTCECGPSCPSVLAYIYVYQRKRRKNPKNPTNSTI
jgi:hypothetical protein